MITQLKSLFSMTFSRHSIVRIQYLLPVLLMIFLLAGCKTSDNTAEVKANENETAIQKYIKDKNLTVQKTLSGLYHNIKNTNPAGQKAAVGDLVTVHFKMTLIDGSLVDSTKTNEPYTFQYGVNRLIAGIEEGIGMMRVGDQATFLMPHTLAYGSQTDTGLPAYSALVVTLKLVNVRTEDQQIDDYIAAKKLTVTEKTSTGLRFVKTTTTAGLALTTNQVVKVKYVGKFLNDKQFDAGDINVTVGGGRVIKGFDEGVAKLKIGEKATLVFPSAIGYGTAGGGTIPPLTPLVFEIEIVQ
jgi:FKBP-type peptidyl-prolyl cis-trans isomerase